MTPALPDDTIQTLLDRIAHGSAAHAARYPGENADRQPVHSVYGGAHLFKGDECTKFGALALKSLNHYAPDAATLSNALGIPDKLAVAVHAKVVDKLTREPIEDFRVDFEDGYGNRSNDDEDQHATAAALATASALASNTLPPFFGIRIKALNLEAAPRALRTLQRYLATLTRESGGKLPANFVVNLPKVQWPDQVSALSDALESLEKVLHLNPGRLKMELMIETPQAIFQIPQLIAAARGRCRSLHFGTYDYTAACNIISAHQHMNHPACDFARHFMQVSTVGTGISLSDGATNVLPIPPYKDPKDAPQLHENWATVHAAWKMHFTNIQRSLMLGFYQGWDLHPAQLVARYAAVHTFFLADAESAAARLSNFANRAAQATRVGAVFDDAATGQGLLNFFLRAVNCGAITEEEVLQTGITAEELRGRSFLAIARNRLDQLPR